MKGLGLCIILNMTRNRSDLRSGTERRDRETTIAKDTLKFDNAFSGNVMKEGIAVIKSTGIATEAVAMYSDWMSHIPANVAMITDMIATAATHFSCVRLKL